MQWRRERSVEVEGDGRGDGVDGVNCSGGGTSHCSSAPLVDRLRVSVGEGVGGAANLVQRAPAPHPFYFGAVQRGPTNH